MYGVAIGLVFDDDRLEVCSEARIGRHAISTIPEVSQLCYVLASLLNIDSKHIGRGGLASGRELQLVMYPTYKCCPSLSRYYTLYAVVVLLPRTAAELKDGVVKKSRARWCRAVSRRQICHS